MKWFFVGALLAQALLLGVVLITGASGLAVLSVSCFTVVTLVSAALNWSAA